MITEQIKQAVKDVRRSAKELRECYKSRKPEIAALAQALKKLDAKIIRATIDNYSIDLAIAGDKHDLNAVFGALRKLGYEPDGRAQEKVASFSTWFRQADFHNIYLSFSSTKCTRVKVGTEMKEVDVYETVCE